MLFLTTFYSNYVALCAKEKKSLSAVAESIGLSRTAPNGWKKGKQPSDVTLEKLSQYFGVPVFELTGEQKEKPPVNDERFLPLAERREALSKAGIHILLDADAKVTEEQLDDIISFIEIQQRRNGR